MLYLPYCRRSSAGPHIVLGRKAENSSLKAEKEKFVPVF